MKASELIKQLQDEIEERGDLEILGTGEATNIWHVVDGLLGRPSIYKVPVIVIELGDEA